MKKAQLFIKHLFPVVYFFFLFINYLTQSLNYFPVTRDDQEHLLKDRYNVWKDLIIVVNALVQ